MEWITGARSNEVDIGYVPLMRVFSASPSKCDNQSSNETYNVSSIAWNQEISMHEALQEIERTMYPFKKVSTHYKLSYPNAVLAAQAQV